MSQEFRLGLDIGANSIGWAIVDLETGGKPASIRDAGVRIFSDGRNPKDRTSLAVARRQARQMRRQRDRYLQRRDKFMNALIRAGLMPEDEAARKTLERLDPYMLRLRCLDERVALFELGRALFHLNQRRGFRSNLRIDKTDDAESGKVRTGGDRLRDLLQDTGARTLGEFLAMRHELHDPVRVRMSGAGAQAVYEFYPQRDMVEAEFDALWESQAQYHPEELSPQWRDELKGILLFQRPLKPVRPGKCTLIPTEERAPAALPLAQRRRILEEVNHLRVSFGPGEMTRPLCREERDKVVLALLQKQKVTFTGIRRLLGFAGDTVFNTESGKRQHLDGDLTSCVLSRKNLFGPYWRARDLETQTEIVERLLVEEDETRLIAWLCERTGVDAQTAERIAGARLPDGHSRLGRSALARVVPALERDVVVYSDAVRDAGFDHHSDFRDGERHDRLSYYGERLERHVAFGTGEPGDMPEKRIGRIANPTVHIGLNQIRRLVNAIIDVYGHPTEIHIELARDLKNSIEKQRDIEREQAENQRRNDERRLRLAECGQPDTGENRLKLRLWEELGPPQDRRCVYTGEQISIRRLLSDDVEIEHILPFSKTLDNSAANKTVCLRRANRDKGNKAPFAAFGHSPDGYDWSGVAARAWELPKNKRWRFAPDAMENLDAGFLDRHLTDTQYISRIAREYLTAVCDPDRVVAIPGRMTAMLRGKWGLNSLLSDHNRKNRTDHRHHAIDAAVVAMTDRGMLNRIARAAARAEESGVSRILEDMPDPWDGFRAQLGSVLDRLVVSHRPDHGKQGRLHNDTAYGLVSEPDTRGARTVVHRKPLGSFKSVKELSAIRDNALRDRIEATVAADAAAGISLGDSLARFSEREGVRRVRICEKLSVIPICDREGKPYKAYKGDSNYCYDIFAVSGGGWRGDVLSTFDANTKGRTPLPDGASRIMRLRKDDLVGIDGDDGRRVMRVVKFSPGQIVLAEHQEGGPLKQRDAAPVDEDPFQYLTRSPEGLRKLNASPLAVDILGRVYDPGNRQ
ncbi:MAG: type II CRISPR RNA-guided endonuclease Cas9 [Alphaproteobacteria bacterium]